MSFYIYQNLSNNRVTIHKGECGFCNEGNGVQQNLLGDLNGEWHLGPNNGYENYEQAVIIAQELAHNMGIEYHDCQRCNPNI